MLNLNVIVYTSVVPDFWALLANFSGPEEAKILIFPQLFFIYYVIY